MRFTKEQRIFSFQQCSLPYEAFKTAWNNRFIDIPAPSLRFRRRLQQKFAKSGSVADLPRSGRPRSARSEENIFHTAIFFVEEFNNLMANLSESRPTTKKAASFLDISISSVQRILKKDVKWSSRTPQRVQILNEKDKKGRKVFCEVILSKLQADPYFLDMVVWTDEAIFKLNGQVRTNLLKYWGDGTNNKIYPRRRSRDGIMVSIGIWRYGIIGPFFFEDLPEISSSSSSVELNKRKRKKKFTVDSKKYLQLLKHCYLPEIYKQIPIEESDLKKEFWFQLDGASIHTAKIVKSYLEEEFPKRWIGNRGHIEWPPNSPDLTPLGNICTKGLTTTQFVFRF